MVAIANAVELFMHIFSSDPEDQRAMTRESIQAGMGLIYVGMTIFTAMAWAKCSDRKFADLLTVADLIQLAGFLMLTVKIRATKSVAGISSRSIELHTGVLAIRIVSMFFRRGYIPVTKTGLSVCQVAHIASLIIVVQILYLIHKKYRHTYQSEEDSFPLKPLVPPCVLLGCCLHTNLNRSWALDSLWATSVNFECVALVPQLWMMARVGGEVHACTGHYIAALVASRFTAFLFWVQAYPYMSAADGSLASGRYLVVTQVLQFLLAADFMYYYVKAMWHGKKIVTIPVDADPFSI